MKKLSLGQVKDLSENLVGTEIGDALLSIIEKMESGEALKLAMALVAKDGTKFEFVCGATSDQEAEELMATVTRSAIPDEDLH